ncbi:MAG: hypothetical protein JNM33_13010 [Rubrivivax sp.]|nr:hypothetical protein [Rubrivivax sp.]
MLAADIDSRTGTSLAPLRVQVALSTLRPLARALAGCLRWCRRATVAVVSVSQSGGIAMLNRSTGSVSGEPSGYVDKFFCFGRSLVKNSALALVASAALVSGASAETLLMPSRDARTTAPVVVWGVHTQPAGTPCALTFGDEATTGLPPFNCTGVDRSYIAQAHTYPGQGTYTARLTVGLETTTTTIQVFDPALLIGGAAGDNNRSLGINMAIQDGLRYLWTTQINRAANFPAGTTTNWNGGLGFPQAETSLAVLAFENQGYKITAGVAPTGIYEKYIVRRGLNYIIANLSVQTLGLTPAGNNPCVGVPAATFADCRGLMPTDASDRGYTTALAILGLAGSGALTQVNTEVAGVTNGMTYGEILQRTVNTLAWGQNDSGNGRGGWDYGFNSTRGDGSTLGWDILALADANAAGMVVPAWTISELNVLMSVPGGGMLNSDGTWDYVANGALSNSSVGPAKNGIGLQGLFLVGETTGARVTAVTNAINSWWNGGPGIGGDSWGCGGAATVNKGCAYTMFNNFKGLKLQNIATLPGVTRPAGPGAQPAGDWYADYEDWLVANQSNPGTTAGGNWSTMSFSSIRNSGPANAAIAELILAPVTLVAPDPVLFSTVGLSPFSATNPVGGTHTVTAIAQAANNAPIAGVTINFRVVNGPNTGKTGSGNTAADGKTSFTYTDTAGPGTDTIQAFIGATISSNQVLATWGLACDLNNDGKVSPADLLLIRGRLNTVATGPTDPYDPNRDGLVNVADMRYCQLRQTATTP